MTGGAGGHASTYDRVLHAIGSAIVSGALPEGHTDTVEGLTGRTGASRSIVREALRVLGALGMISAGRRVGVKVLPRATWNVLDPLVIRWRLASPERAAQLAELRALRRAVEPEAARLAAHRPAPDQVEHLREAAAHLATSQGAEEFLVADRRLHGLVLAMSGNAMFVRLQAVVDEALRERAHRPDRPDHAVPHDVELHLAVAEAVARHDGDRAAALMRTIIDRTAGDEHGPHT
ncbi:FadR/GntR family transcriptional regulator [Pseudonocardia sp. MH-G8]|uniref:FadR/GntR family transcriptional regulator n=1 Tax=Pseudonocardia sp. MH-G8 TaxID=1854588 RepID=UPI000B9FAA70|nr:FCD domain-containing protein [Pseudonocardia sp. MH-G8]OZM76474.1 GntR family transcriptional regulator [Pseudonocardia sp. MH-G8]